MEKIYEAWKKYACASLSLELKYDHLRTQLMYDFIEEIEGNPLQKMKDRILDKIRAKKRA
jgi:hypothetical protein